MAPRAAWRNSRQPARSLAIPLRSDERGKTEHEKGRYCGERDRPGKAVVLGDQTVNGTFYADGTVLFETPGFSGTNGLPTITCTNTSPVSGITARVTGYVAPTK